jgi:hypothetical protein
MRQSKKSERNLRKGKMTIPNKFFDCVEAKHMAQEALEREFERRRGEFASLADFLNAKTL